MPAVPFAMTVPDRAPKERYYDEGFFALEAEQLWSRTWQMACRSEEVPEVGDWVTYEILDQSVLVVRVADGDDGVRAFQNACRHRGVRVAVGRGTGAEGFTCPFHGWCYGLDGANTHIPMRRSFAEHNLADGVDLLPVRCELWGGCAWINLDDAAPPLRASIEPAATILDGWKVESLRVEWWYACRLPVNWKLAEQAFQEQYHVVEAHPQLVIPGMRYSSRPGAPFDPRVFLAAELQYLRTMSEGMDGMVHASDVAVAERLAGSIELPAEPELAMATWHRSLNSAVVEAHREAGHDVPDLNELEDAGVNEPMGYVFPHWFVLPMYSSASSYRFRPLGPEETLMEIWSLVRRSPADPVVRPTPPEVWEHDDPRWPPIPAQDFSNLPRQQQGLHARGFEFMRLSAAAEGHLANLERVVDAYLAGLPHERLLPLLREVNVNPLERPLVPELGMVGST